MGSSPIDRELLATLERSFAKHAGGDARIDLEDLKKALGLRTEYLAKRMLALFDRDGDGTIDKGEFLEGVRTLVMGTDQEKLLFAFRLHDHDGDGVLDAQEILRMISMSLAESDIAGRVSQPPEFLARVLLGEADKNGDGRVSFEELATVVSKRPGLLRAMTHAEAIWIAPNEDLLLMAEERASGQKLRGGAFPQRPPAAWVWLSLFALANVAIFTASMLRGLSLSASAPLVEAGRATARCLDFCGALLLVPMMRRLGTWVRARWLGRVLPVDEAIDFHKVVGHAMFFLSLAHVALFVIAFGAGHPPGKLQWLLHTSRGLTGALLLGVFAVMWFFSLSFIRRTRHFELFAVTHWLWAAWFALAIAHGPPFVFWAGVPLLGFLVEQLVRRFRRSPPCVVSGSRALRSGVTRLEVVRPPGFDFSPGDYVFLRIPAIARFEWHPFTISSAPERPELAFHVRSLGNWTAALRRRVEEMPDGPGLVAYVDGPYGSPSAHIFQAKHAVLIAGGIGVTPFASVLESIVLRAQGMGGRPSSLEKVHFVWLNRDQYAFEWFTALLSELEKLDTRSLLDVQLWLTGARGGVTSMGLEIAREIMRAAGRGDMITGLRTHTHTGTPDWEAILRAIRAQHAGERVDVFFCGPPGLAKRIRPVCARLDLPFREERF